MWSSHTPPEGRRDASRNPGTDTPSHQRRRARDRPRLSQLRGNLASVCAAHSRPPGSPRRRPARHGPGRRASRSRGPPRGRCTRRPRRGRGLGLPHRPPRPARQPAAPEAATAGPARALRPRPCGTRGQLGAYAAREARGGAAGLAGPAPPPGGKRPRARGPATPEMEAGRALPAAPRAHPGADPVLPRGVGRGAAPACRAPGGRGHALRQDCGGARPASSPPGHRSRGSRAHRPPPGGAGRTPGPPDPGAACTFCGEDLRTRPRARTRARGGICGELGEWPLPGRGSLAIPAPGRPPALPSRSRVGLERKGLPRPAFSANGLTESRAGELPGREGEIPRSPQASASDGFPTWSLGGAVRTPSAHTPGEPCAFATPPR